MALRLVESFPGVEVFVPLDPLPPEHRLVRVLGPRRRRRSCGAPTEGYHKGPHAVRAMRAVRDEQIQEERRQGAGLAELALRHHLTDRYVSIICNAPEPDDAQRDLFDPPLGYTALPNRFGCRAPARLATIRPYVPRGAGRATPHLIVLGGLFRRDGGGDQRRDLPQGSAQMTLLKPLIWFCTLVAVAFVSHLLQHPPPRLGDLGCSPDSALPFALLWSVFRPGGVARERSLFAAGAVPRCCLGLGHACTKDAVVGTWEARCRWWRSASSLVVWFTNERGRVRLRVLGPPAHAGAVRSTRYPVATLGFGSQPRSAPATACA